MLDVDTKRRIDTARDILVGKVPDPKSQVEQITIALIYKFMDDLDAESEEFGGERKFFAGDFARYGWAKLMHPSLGGYETLNLYAEAITRMPENPGIPPLFRDIFNNAYLPYRDPETLRAFLKVIDDFTYDHSERLGDAFEYLLSVLGAQGDAGQFRTPRHIIDFMVAVVDPKKDDVVLDPACGTAGFLISAYKHILAANTDGNGQTSLTPDDRGRLVNNFKGYDISPDMVRLSLVNMYLHGFREPHIYEYDTLTSEERWSEYADVILANPPFMSPKGGIRPHNRFSVQSRRSEVLFIDYMAEHLTPNGRAGIIVPEGIVFQSQTAYRQLRKLLVEDYLVAVVSLPAGVFNPYSGVKTSVLILDRALAKWTDDIGFFKVESDGFDLGAQRRPIDRNDLPHVQAELSEYLRRARSSESLADFTPTLGLVVSKEKLAADGEYNLSGGRYQENLVSQSSWPTIALGKVAEVIAGQSPPGDSYNDAGIGTPFYQGKTEFRQMFIGEPVKWTTDPRRFADKGDLLISVRAPVGPVNMSTQQVCIGRGLAAIKPKAESLIALYAFYILRSIESKITGSTGAAFASINKGEVEKIEIPLPPLSIQQEIVAEIEGYQRVIDGARAVVENYRPHIVVDPGWPTVKIGEVCNLVNGRAFKPQDWEPASSGGLPIVRIQNLNNPGSEFNYYTGEVEERHIIHNGELLFSWSGSRGTSFGAHIWTGEKAVLNQHIFKVGFNPSNAEKQYLFFALNQAVSEVEQNLHGGVGLVHITKGNLERIRIPLPSLNQQQAISADLDAEQSLVDANRELIQRFEGKIQASIARVWECDPTVVPEA